MMEQMVRSKTSQATGVKSVLTIGLLLTGGLLLAPAIFLTGHKVPNQVTCDPVTALESAPSLEQMQNATQSVKGSAQRFMLTKSDNYHDSLKIAAEYRKRRLLTLFISDPPAARRQLLRRPERERLETVTKDCFETEIKVAGRLEILHGEDFTNRREYRQYFLANGQKKYSLFGLEKVADVPPGATIEVSGHAIDDNLLVGAPSFSDPQPTVQITSVVPPPAMLNVPTARKLLVLMGDFNNTDLRTPDYATVQTVFPKISSYFEENSYNLVTFNTTSFDWFEMNLARGSGCDVYGVTRELIRLADPQVDFAQFDLADLAVLAPFPSSCAWGGMSSVTPQSYATAEGNVQLTTVWIKTPATAADVEGVLIHELGHNIAGFGHANWTRCPDGEMWKNNTTCNVNFPNGYPEWGNWEYGDPFDIMGGWYYPTYRGYGLGHFNAARKAVSGWVPADEVVTIDSGDPGRTVTLVPLERGDAGIKLIKIQRSATEYLTVQYRQPTFADGSPNIDGTTEFATAFPAIFDGASIHTTTGSPTYLMDVTPLPTNDPADPVLRVGQTLTDPVTGATVRVDSKTSDALTVTVTPPAIDFSPPPVPMAIRDGLGADIDTTNDATSLSANWEPVIDVGSGLNRYEHSISVFNYMTQEYSDIASGQTGLNTSVTVSGLTLTPGETYYVNVRAVDNYGLTSWYNSSDGVTINQTPPAVSPTLTIGSVPAPPDCVYDGPDVSEDRAATNATDVLLANWCTAPAHSTINRYQYAFGSTPGGTDIVDYTDIGKKLYLARTGLSLEAGQRYYVSVRSVSASNVAGPSRVSDGILVDQTSPPAPVVVNDGRGADIDVTASSSSLSANWQPVSDPSGVSVYQYAIGTSPGAGDVQSFWPTSLASVTVDNLSLTTGHQYFVTVRAIDRAGNIGAAMSSDGIVSDPLSDSTPPTVTITAPTAGSTVGRLVTISTDVTDNIEVVGVRYQVDGVDLTYNEDSIPPYEVVWNTTGSSNGTHTVSVIARDEAQSTTASMQVTVYNAPGTDVYPPLALIGQPTAGSIVQGTVSIWAVASDFETDVSYVQFLLDGQLLGNQIPVPGGYYNAYYPWDSRTVANGTHRLEMKAVDVQDNVGTAAPVTFVVNNPDVTSPADVTDLRRQ